MSDASATLDLPASRSAPRDAPIVRRHTAARSITGHAPDARTPTVAVDDRVPRAWFTAALESGPLAEFPLEVDMPAVLPDKLAVAYPAAALEHRREGRVLAWAIVDAHGAVEATQIVAGEADFAEAAQSALAGAQFVPARMGGAPIRFYVTLAFAFRLEFADAAASPAPAGQPSNGM